MNAPNQLYESAVLLLESLISIPSVSGEEDQTASCLERFLVERSVQTNRRHNNIWCSSTNHQPGAPVVLLNSHHDTVKASGAWSNPPHSPVIIDDRLYGLGSNDAGASVVSLTATFLHLSSLHELPCKLILALTAEEEISGPKGVSSILGELGAIDLAVVGEPTEMQMAIAEKGLIVLDCHAEGKPGHAARDEGLNAIYVALSDIEYLRNYKFDKTSEMLGPVKMTVTQINAGSQHNVIPATCEFVVDVRTNEQYSNQQVLETIQNKLQSRVTARSLRLNSSGISREHPVVIKGKHLGLSCFGSPTLSDQSMMNFDSIKIGPGNSSRSHTADEFILLSEIKSGIDTYIDLLTDLNLRS